MVEEANELPDWTRLAFCIASHAGREHEADTIEGSPSKVSTTHLVYDLIGDYSVPRPVSSMNAVTYHEMTSRQSI